MCFAIEKLGFFSLSLQNRSQNGRKVKIGNSLAFSNSLCRKFSLFTTVFVSTTDRQRFARSEAEKPEGVNESLRNGRLRMCLSVFVPRSVRKEWTEREREKGVALLCGVCVSWTSRRLIAFEANSSEVCSFLWLRIWKVSRTRSLTSSSLRSAANKRQSGYYLVKQWRFERKSFSLVCGFICEFFVLVLWNPVKVEYFSFQSGFVFIKQLFPAQTSQRTSVTAKCSG